jgi:hypothetical protein
MDFSTFQEVVRAGTPFDTGYMMTNGWAYFDTPYQFVAIANETGVPYIVYNEDGTIYSKKNKGFISKGITGQLNQITYSEQLGLPYSFKEQDNTLRDRRNDMLVSMGVLEVRR